MVPKVSVVIPFYNGVEWLCEAVQSVLEQTYTNLEIIVVNDGSPENVDQFLQKYENKVLYFKKENGGPASARNYGIDKATGDYIALLDSDDVWLPQKTELQISFMKNNNIMWSHTGFSFWWPETGELKTPNIKYNFGDIRKLECVSFKMSTPSVIIDSRVFQEHPELRFPVDMRYGQDTGFFKILCNYYPVGLLNKVLMHVRIRGANANGRALVRFKVNSHLKLMYKTLMKDRFPKPTVVYMIILSIYDIDYKIANIARKLLRNKEDNLETFAKFLWVLPWVIEKIYSKYLLWGKQREIKNEMLFYSE